MGFNSGYVIRVSIGHPLLFRPGRAKAWATSIPRDKPTVFTPLKCQFWHLEFWNLSFFFSKCSSSFFIIRFLPSNKKFEILEGHQGPIYLFGSRMVVYKLFKILYLVELGTEFFWILKHFFQWLNFKNTEIWYRGGAFDFWYKFVHLWQRCKILKFWISKLICQTSNIKGSNCM